MIPVKSRAIPLAAAAALLLCAAPGLRAADAKKPAKSAAELEKEKALSNPYPNDFGPAEIDDQVKTYPKEIQAGYALLKERCAQCHAPSRPLNSRFLEVEGKTDEEREKNLGALKKDQPDLFKDQSVWQVETKIWNRYVKRMMAKPGCNIDRVEGKKIWEFLVYDGVRRKTGANAEKWKAHRLKLIAELKAKHPHRYEELKKDNDL